MFSFPYRNKRKKETEIYLFKLRAEIIAAFHERMLLSLCQITKKEKFNLVTFRIYLSFSAAQLCILL